MPSTLFSAPAHLDPSVARLFWGKAAHATFEAFGCPEGSLVIGPTEGDHPIPGERSLASGERLLEFLATLSNRKIRYLEVYLSGGASSLAWVLPWGVSLADVQSKLEGLYRSGLTIEELNRARSKLCLLKAGGTARWLKKVAPRVSARVYVISDVAPFGVHVVGGGPFFGHFKHQIVMDSDGWVRAVEKCVPGQVLCACSGVTGSVAEWSEILSKKIRKSLSEHKSGILICAGEPTVRLSYPAQSKKIPGGRMAHLGLLLAICFAEELSMGKIEILCASSDGVDGLSETAGVCLIKSDGICLKSKKHLVKKALKNFQASQFLKKNLDAGIPLEITGMNVQDLVLIRVMS